MADPLNVLVFLRGPTELYRARLADSGSVRYLFCESASEAAARIGQADVLLASIGFPQELLGRGERLRWIQVAGAGADAFLSGGTLPSDVLLTRVNVSFGEPIAEYVIAHLLARTQRIHEVHRLQAARQWRPLTVERLAGRTMGIAGTGSIGGAVAQRARGFGLRTIGLSRSGSKRDGFDACHAPDRLRAFLRELDILVICLPLTSATRGLFGREELSWMKRTSILVNVARGSIVDEEALIEALQERRIAAAVLDVFEQEPLPASSPLWAMENVTVTSHHAGLNVPDDIADYFLANLGRFRAGGALHGLVDPTRGY